MAIAVSPSQLRIFISESDRAYPDVEFVDPEKPTDEEQAAALKWTRKEGFTEFLVTTMPESMSIEMLDGVDIHDLANPDSIAVAGMGTRIRKICKECCRGWTDEHPLRNEDGEAVPFSMKGGLLSDDALARIAWIDKVNMSHAIMKGGRLDEGDLGKPEPLHTE